MRLVARTIYFLDEVRELIMLAGFVIYAQARWRLRERWKHDAPKEGPFDCRDVI